MMKMFRSSHDTGIGSRVPLHCTASGKIFLAFTPSLRRMLFRSQPLHRYTPHTLTTAEQIEGTLANIRKTAIGTDNGEFMEGMAAAAVPIYDARGRLCATVAVHGPVTRLPLERALAFVPILKKASKEIEKTLMTEPS